MRRIIGKYADAADGRGLNSRSNIFPGTNADCADCQRRLQTNPLRLLEEISMLDQMSGGRLEVGLCAAASGG